MLEKFKKRLIDDARYWYKMWSSWLALAFGAVVTWFWTDPSWMASLVVSLPYETRALMSPLVLGIVSALPIVIRLLKQAKARG